MLKPHLLKETLYRDIKSYSKNLMIKLKDYGVPFGLDQFPLFIEINCGNDPDSLEALIKAAATKEIVAVIGIDANSNTFKVSFLALDKDGNVDQRHLDNKLPGQETWPPKGTYPAIKADDPLSTIEPPK